MGNRTVLNRDRNSPAAGRRKPRSAMRRAGTKTDRRPPPPPPPADDRPSEGRVRSGASFGKVMRRRRRRRRRQRFLHVPNLAARPVANSARGSAECGAYEHRGLFVGVFFFPLLLLKKFEINWLISLFELASTIIMLWTLLFFCKYIFYWNIQIHKKLKLVIFMVQN